MKITMKNRIVVLFLQFFFVLMAMSLSACGGGGGNPGGTSSSGGTATSGTTTSSSSATLSVTLYDSTGTVVTTVTSGGANYFKALFLDSQGVPVSGKVVTFAIASSSLATLTTSTALTNTQGVAQVSVAPAGASSGATTVTATASTGAQSVTGSNDFAVTGIGSSGGGATGRPSLTLQLFNSSNASTTNVSVGGGNYLKATVLDASSTPVVGRVVTFSAIGSSLTTFTPSAATALTNSSGIAQVSVAPVSVSSSGAGTFSAQTNASGVTVTGTIDYSVSPVNFNLGAIALGSASLSSGASTSVVVRATAVSGGAGVSAVAVGFSADCGTIQSVVTTDGSGYASATYSSVKTDGTLCSGTVTLSAVANGAATQSTTLSVAAPVANAITFVSATPAQIFIKGSGAAEQSVVKFKVLAGTVSQPNVDVKFTLTENPGGVGIGASNSTTPVTVQSDLNGEASMPVFSGTLPGPLKIRAELGSNASVFADTSNLTVFSGPPAQNFFDLSVDIYNIEGQNYSGVPAVLSMIVGDRQGNPVPDGTVINFTSEGGQVAGSCATLKVNGIARCLVNFVSGEPRPANGRVSILAFTEGVKKFIDTNNDNAYTSGTDTLVDQGDAYRDDNENNSYELASDSFRIAKGGSTTCAGTGSPAPSVVNTCTGTATLVTTVRKQAVVMFSSSYAAATLTSGSVGALAFRLNSADHALLPMPMGTALVVDGISGVPTGTTCSASVLPASVVNVTPGNDPNAQRGTNHQIVFMGNGCGAGVTYIIKVTSPKGAVTPLSFASPLTLSTYSASLSAGAPSATVNVTGGTSPYTVVSSNTGVATVSVAAGVVTVTRVAAGTATITVTDNLGFAATIAVTSI